MTVTTHVPMHVPGVGAYCIRPPNGPERGRMTIPRGRVFATDGGARWGVCCCASYTGTRTNKPTGRSPQQTNTKRATGPNGWTPDMIIRPVPGRLVGRMQYAPTLPAGGPSSTRPNSPVSADTPRQMPRDLRDSRKRHGKCRETCGNSRKRHGKCRETCGTPANATANAERLAGTPANATANAERLAGTPANILST